MQRDFTQQGPLIWLSQTSANASDVRYSVQLDALIGRVGEGNSAGYTREANGVMDDIRCCPEATRTSFTHETVGNVLNIWHIQHKGTENFSAR